MAKSRRGELLHPLNGSQQLLGKLARLYMLNSAHRCTKLWSPEPRLRHLIYPTVILCDRLAALLTGSGREELAFRMGPRLKAWVSEMV